MGWGCRSGSGIYLLANYHLFKDKTKESRK